MRRVQQARSVARVRTRIRVRATAMVPPWSVLARQVVFACAPPGATRRHALHAVQFGSATGPCRIRPRPLGNSLGSFQDPERGAAARWSSLEPQARSWLPGPSATSGPANTHSWAFRRADVVETEEEGEGPARACRTAPPRAGSERSQVHDTALEHQSWRQQPCSSAAGLGRPDKPVAGAILLTLPLARPYGSTVLKPVPLEPAAYDPRHSLLESQPLCSLRTEHACRRRCRPPGKVNENAVERQEGAAGQTGSAEAESGGQSQGRLLGGLTSDWEIGAPGAGSPCGHPLRSRLQAARRRPAPAGAGRTWLARSAGPAILKVTVRKPVGPRAYWQHAVTQYSPLPSRLRALVGVHRGRGLGLRVVTSALITRIYASRIPGPSRRLNVIANCSPCRSAASFSEQTTLRGRIVCLARLLSNVGLRCCAAAPR